MIAANWPIGRGRKARWAGEVVVVVGGGGLRRASLAWHSACASNRPMRGLWGGGDFIGLPFPESICIQYYESVSRRHYSYDLIVGPADHTGYGYRLASYTAKQVKYRPTQGGPAQPSQAQLSHVMSCAVHTIGLRRQGCKLLCCGSNHSTPLHSCQPPRVL